MTGTPGLPKQGADVRNWSRYWNDVLLSKCPEKRKLSIIKIALPCLFLVLMLTSPVSGKGWRGITPLRSTRADVERLLGPPEKPDAKHMSDYKLEDEVVSIIYATGPPCGEGMESGWQVPAGTVVDITVAPRKTMRPSDLKLDKSKYQRIDGGHQPDVASYINKKEGIKIAVFQDNVVTSITYFPAEEDNYLLCPEARRKLTERSTSELTIKEKDLLDCFMLRLKQEPTATGWVRIDRERRRVDEPALTDLVSEYLRSKYPTEFNRVSVMGAYRLAQEMELFIVPRDGDPTPIPEKTSKSKCFKQG